MTGGRTIKVPDVESAERALIRKFNVNSESSHAFWLPNKRRCQYADEATDAAVGLMSIHDAQDKILTHSIP